MGEWTERGSGKKKWEAGNGMGKRGTGILGISK